MKAGARYGLPSSVSVFPYHRCNLRQPERTRNRDDVWRRSVAGSTTRSPPRRPKRPSVTADRRMIFQLPLGSRRSHSHQACSGRALHLGFSTTSQRIECRRAAPMKACEGTRDLRCAQGEESGRVRLVGAEELAVRNATTRRGRPLDLHIDATRALVPARPRDGVRALVASRRPLRGRCTRASVDRPAPL